MQAADASEAKTKDVGTLLPMEAEVFVSDVVDHVCVLKDAKHAQGLLLSMAVAASLFI